MTEMTKCKTLAGAPGRRQTDASVWAPAPPGSGPHGHGGFQRTREGAGQLDGSHGVRATQEEVQSADRSPPAPGGPVDLVPFVQFLSRKTLLVLWFSD